MEVRKILWLSPEPAEPDGEGSVTVAPDSCCCINIATGFSASLSVSSLFVSLRLPLGQQIEASPKVGHEKMELTDVTPLLREGRKFSLFFCRFLKCRRDARCCQLL